MAIHETVRAGHEALAAGNWSSAEEHFTRAVQEEATPDAIDGLGLARWWQRDVRAGIALRTRAHREFKAAGRSEEAALVAVWLAREHRSLFRNVAVSDGWLRRAQTLTQGTASSVEGWLHLARAEASTDPAEAVGLARQALAAARSHADADLELVSLAQLGLYSVMVDDVDTGTSLLDEAMAGVSAGDARDLQSVGTVYCALMEAAALLGDNERLTQWAKEVAACADQGLGPFDDAPSTRAYGRLAGFCGACCGGMYLVTGRVDDAESVLLTAISDLEAHGMSSRCVHPVTQLAEMRFLQGRFEEARALLVPYEDMPEAARPLARLDLALGAPDLALARLTTALEQVGSRKVVALPLLTVLVEAQLSLLDVAGAARSTADIARVAELTKSRSHRAEQLLAAGRVAAASERPDATSLLGDAAAAFAEAALPLESGRARLARARCLATADHAAAVTEARAARATFERLGAASDTDAATAFLRTLGIKGRTGPRTEELLSKRESEVLGLLARGLSNPEIAARLYISTKTAEHHVSSILNKLGLRSRTEAAAYGALHPAPSGPGK